MVNEFIVSRISTQQTDNGGVNDGQQLFVSSISVRCSVKREKSVRSSLKSYIFLLVHSYEDTVRNHNDFVINS